MANGEVPVGVKVIAVLYYIGAVLGLIFGILFIAGSGSISSIETQIPGLSALGASLFIVAGIILIALGVLGFFIGRGLWKARHWARIVAIIFACLGTVLGILGVIQGAIAQNIIGLIISVIIAGYLIFSNKVKEAFA